MKKSLYILLLPFVLFGQQTLVNETANDFGFTTDANTVGHWVLDSTKHADILLDLTSNDLDLTQSGGFASPQTGSNPARENGTSIDFNGSDELSVASSLLNPGTGDFTIEITFYSGTLGWLHLFEKKSATEGYRLRRTGTSAQHTLYGNSTEVSQIYAISADKYYYAVTTFDRSGNMTTRITEYGQSLATSGASSIAAITNDLNPSEAFFIASNGGGNYYDDEIAEIRYSDKIRTLKEIKESYLLMTGWSSYNGDLATRGASTWNQGITGSGLTVSTNSGLSYSPTITGSSTTYTSALGTSTFSTDSLKISTDTETITYPLPDVSNTSGYQWQISIDAWETGGAVYVDNIVFDEIAVEVASEKGFPKFKQFTKFKE